MRWRRSGNTTARQDCGRPFREPSLSSPNRVCAVAGTFRLQPAAKDLEAELTETHTAFLSSYDSGAWLPVKPEV